MLNLFTAAYEGKQFVVAQLIDQGNSDGRTALHWAASGGHEELVAYLLENSALVNATDESGWTPLTIAVSAGHTPVVQALLERGADTSVQNESGQTALLQIGKILLDHHAELNPVNRILQTPMHRAAAQGHKVFVKLLLDAKARVNPRDHEGNTPLHLACEEQQGDVALELILHGGDVDRLNQNGQTPLAMCEPTIRAYLESQLE
ncbi:hypothetical protein DFQ28_010250 [Apophysomyces sp. BC1034]|nr:hypothetical protein DFQ29_004413 [Apophysomyces sp. BC1021]KAG0192074.1 hypothetical protein DFQ28_010250 [Apophysomyces sp. BC1034]